MATRVRQKTRLLALSGVTLAGTVGGFFLRRWQLADAFDADGLMLLGRPSIWVLGLFCAVVVVALALLCRGLKRRGGYEESFSSSGFNMALTLVGAAALLCGCAAQVVTNFPVAPETMPAGAGPWLNAEFVLGALGIVAGLAMALIAVQRFRGSVPPVSMHFLPCVYLVVKLIVEFKRWSVDPAILDYCFLLFAAISAMCATYHLGGFCFNRGGRRISTFWCLAATVFAGVCLADGGTVRILLLGGMGLWLAGNGWQLLED